MEHKNRFYFDLPEVDNELAREANLRLLELLALGPPGGEGTGRLELGASGYTAKVTLRSPFRSFVSAAVGSTQKGAVRKAIDRMEDELFRWRYGSGHRATPIAGSVYSYR